MLKKKKVSNVIEKLVEHRVQASYLKLGDGFFLAHLSHRLRVSYCHWPMSVVRRPSSTIALNNISSETARPRALIFGM